MAIKSKKRRKILIGFIPVFAFVVVVVVLSYKFVIVPESKENNATCVKSETSSDTKTANKPEVTDTSFKDNHMVSNSRSGFTSPYGYYYFDTRFMSQDSTEIIKDSLFFFDYKSHKTSEVNCRIAKSSESKTNSDESPMFEKGSFYKDKIYLTAHNMNGNGIGFDLYRGNFDGTDFKKIYSTDMDSQCECVFCDNKVYYALNEQLTEQEQKDPKKKNKVQIVSIDLDSLESTVVFSKEGFDANISLTDFYKDRICFAYDDYTKKRPQLDIDNSDAYDDFEKYLKENSISEFDIKTGKTKVVSENMISDGFQIEGKYKLKSINSKTKVAFEITDLETNENYPLTLYENTKSGYENSNNQPNDYLILDSKIIYYTEANKVTDEMNCYDLKTKKIIKFKKPVVTDKKNSVDFALVDTCSDGFIYEKNITDKKSGNCTTTLCYLSKEDYFQGKANYIDFDY